VVKPQKLAVLIDLKGHLYNS